MVNVIGRMILALILIAAVVWSNGQVSDITALSILGVVNAGREESIGTLAEGYDDSSDDSEAEITPKISKLEPYWPSYDSAKWGEGGTDRKFSEEVFGEYHYKDQTVTLITVGNIRQLPFVELPRETQKARNKRLVYALQELKTQGGFYISFDFLVLTGSLATNTLAKECRFHFRLEKVILRPSISTPFRLASLPLELSTTKR